MIFKVDSSDGLIMSLLHIKYNYKHRTTHIHFIINS